MGARPRPAGGVQRDIGSEDVEPAPSHLRCANERAACVATLRVTIFSRFRGGALGGSKLMRRMKLLSRIVTAGIAAALALSLVPARAQGVAIVATEAFEFFPGDVKQPNAPLQILHG